jgi:hypothetical protein
LRGACLFLQRGNRRCLQRLGFRAHEERSYGASRYGEVRRPGATNPPVQGGLFWPFRPGKSAPQRGILRRPAATNSGVQPELGGVQQTWPTPPLRGWGIEPAREDSPSAVTPCMAHRRPLALSRACGLASAHPTSVGKPEADPVFALAPRPQEQTRPRGPVMKGKGPALPVAVYTIKAGSCRCPSCRQATWSAGEEPGQQDRPPSTTSHPVSRRSLSTTLSQVLPHHWSLPRSRSQWPHLA